MTRVVAIVQARMTSTRLPGKVLADLCGRPMLERMLERVGRCHGLTEIVVATTRNATDDPIVALCDALKVRSYRGDEADVLGRFDEAATQAMADVVVRLTADCPAHDAAVVADAISLFLAKNADYVSNVRRRSYPVGLDVEVMSREALRTAARDARHPYLREHVTPYIRGTRPDLGRGDFQVEDLVFPADFSGVRWTVDTASDLAAMRALWAAAPEGFTWLQGLAAAVRDPRLFNDVGASSSELRLRPAQSADAELLYQWVNEPSSLAAKLTTASPIAWDTHIQWLIRRLCDPTARIWIAEADGVPVGQTRVERRPSGRLEVDVYVPPHRRRRGFAERMLMSMAAEAGAAFPGEPLIALVRKDNDASQRLFAAAGYRPAGVEGDAMTFLRPAMTAGSP